MLTTILYLLGEQGSWLSESGVATRWLLQFFGG